MNVYSPEEFKEIDAYTLRKNQWEAWELMERAAVECVADLLRDFSVPQRTVVWIGPGNNGGDGLAIARLLRHLRWPVQVVAPGDLGKSEAVVRNRDLWGAQNIHSLDSWSKLNEAPPELIIDALFGVGLNRGLEGYFVRAVEQINQFAGPVYSVDVPSGLLAEWPLNVVQNSGDRAIVCATKTWTFQFPKTLFFLPGNADFTGHLQVLDIGLDDGCFPASATRPQYITPGAVHSFRVVRGATAHKGSAGTLLVFAGRASMLGAGAWVCRAAHRAGVGRVWWNLPEELHAQGALFSPESTMLNSRVDAWSTAEVNAIAVGPGWGTDEASERTLKRILQEARVPLVLDADATAILANNPTWLAFLPAHTILTPHLKEFHRMLQRETNPNERLSVLAECAQKWNCIVVLKGPHTAIATPQNQLFFNASGNAALASAGTGDVLTGMIAAYLAQGMPAVRAVLYAVSRHGSAADWWVQNHTVNSFGPERILNFLENFE